MANKNRGNQGSDMPWENTMKPILLDILKNGTKDITVEKLFIKEKVVRLVVEAAKRFWPHYWVDMDDVLRQLFYSSQKHQELVLGIYRTLSEDIYILEDDVATLRKRDLSTSMSPFSLAKICCLPFTEIRLRILMRSGRKRASTWKAS
ncbi:hypothetical protein BC829DRAFT_74883 [Chytridium lagenaria]|nr:hypothetical protein BC829DRAFT_74883 [Chytridium lagenaria]